MSQQQRPYRSCVGIVLFNDRGQVFVGQRIDTPNAWQMPQGGIDPGEDIKAAAYRELLEETGTNQAEIIEIAGKSLFYDLPKELQSKLWGGHYRGQEQHWVAMRFTGSDNDINLNHHSHPEFNEWKWVALEQIFDLIVPFKRDVYKQVIALFSDHVT